MTHCPTVEVPRAAGHSAEGPHHPGGHSRVRVIRFTGPMGPGVQRKLWNMMWDHDRSDTIIDLSAAELDLAGTGMLVAFLAHAGHRGQQVIIVCRDTVKYKALLATCIRQAVRIAPSH